MKTLIPGIKAKPHLFVIYSEVLKKGDSDVMYLFPMFNACDNNFNIHNNQILKQGKVSVLIASLEK